MKKLTLAPVAAIVILGISGYANAESGKGKDTGMDIYKEIDVSADIDFGGSAWVYGAIGVNKLGMAAIDSYQNSTNNNANAGQEGSAINNFRNTNNSKLGGEGTASDLAGNVGINMSSGDNNVQANNAAITVLGDSEADPVGGESVAQGRGLFPIFDDKGAAVDAEISSAQVASGNATLNYGNHNDAVINGGSLSENSGNLGVNVAAGNSNVQANNFAVSYGKDAQMAMATVDNKQFATGNTTVNKTLLEEDVARKVSLTMRGNVSGSYQGESEQSNNVYPEIWLGPINRPSQNHPDGDNYIGHLDFDGTPGSSAANSPRDNGVESHFKFEESGTVDLGEVTLSGELITYKTVVGRTNVNNAVLSGGSLNGSSGNIGVNVTAGTNNLQSNNLALSVGNF
ncbi:hypothetical protein [Oceanimonas sp. CAM02]|uniref:hypothetical protein n=1 Tax=Oceanimonas sp. CAM02 TaxID=3080336 RepID=UPI002935768A|nr:hypothetical protein [Oceanimonas sp. CAM02]MDV2857272.1 hypothetical protein [Oceanimonas sp. CAM02]